MASLSSILFVVFAALLAPASALRVSMHAVQQSASVARSAQPQMALPSIKDAETLSDEELSKEVLTAQKVSCGPARAGHAPKPAGPPAALRVPAITAAALCRVWG